MIFIHPGLNWVSFKASNSVCIIQRFVQSRLKSDVWECNVLHHTPTPTTPDVFGLSTKGVDSLKVHFEVFSSTLAQLQTINCLDVLSGFIYEQ